MLWLMRSDPTLRKFVLLPWEKQTCRLKDVHSSLFKGYSKHAGKKAFTLCPASLTFSVWTGFGPASWRQKPVATGTGRLRGFHFNTLIQADYGSKKELFQDFFCRRAREEIRTRGRQKNGPFYLFQPHKPRLNWREFKQLFWQKGPLSAVRCLHMDKVLYSNE